MPNSVLVNANGAQFYVQVVGSSGTETMASSSAYSFDDVQAAISAIGSSVIGAWQAVRPTEASVEFSLQLQAKSGKLLGLLVDGESKAALKVTLTWKETSLHQTVESKSPEAEPDNSDDDNDGH